MTGATQTTFDAGHSDTVRRKEIQEGLARAGTTRRRLLSSTLRASAPLIIPVSPCLDTQVHDCQLDYYGRRLATCSSDRIIKVGF
jgi:hypothetical protein